jgi:outer membrane protein
MNPSLYTRQSGFDISNGIKIMNRESLMLHKFSLAIAVSCASSSMAWAADLPMPTKTGLVSVYQEAVDNNADLAAARADYAARKEVVPQARAGLLPNLSAGANVNNTRTSIDQPNVIATRSGTVYQATLSQPIFRADRWFQLQAAEAVNEQAALELSATEQNLILESAQNYFTVLRAQDNLASTKAEEAAFKRQLDQANERFDVGLSDKTDVLQAQASYDTARASRIVAKRQVDDAFQALVTLTNRDYNAIEGIVHTLPILPPTPNDAKAWVDTAAQQNLNLLASNYAVNAAEETLRQRKAGHAPTLDAVAQYQRGDNDALGFSNPNYTGQNYRGDVEQRSIGVQLNIPIYSGGLTSSQVREAYSRLGQSEQRREGLRRQVVENTRNLHRAVNTDVEQVQARKQSIISNQSALEATEIGYQVGTRNIVDVLDAQRQLYASVRDYNNTRYDYILDNLRLKQAAGTLNPGDLQDLSRYLKADYNPDKDFLPPDLAAAAKKNFERPPSR